MRRFIDWTFHMVLDSVDLVVAGVPIPAVVAARAIAGISPLLKGVQRR